MNNWRLQQLGEITDAEIKLRLQHALYMLVKNDAFLLEYSVNERSIAHKLAEYLQHQFVDWHVDCEYNKHGIDVKILERFCDGKDMNFVYPDINVHHRNTDDNLLVFEIKPCRADKVNQCDDAKLIKFTEHSGNYCYRLGVFIGFDNLNEPQIVWYRNGQQVEL